ncbi:MAG: SAM hydroxide adenosyltransferase [Candidatus Hodarchaeales archaeon]|jgi:S-adenosylmethionine hydrolase
MIDTFGNIITNIPSSPKTIQSRYYLTETDHFTERTNYKVSYFEGSTIKPFLTSNSFDTFESALETEKHPNSLNYNQGIKLNFSH